MAGRLTVATDTWGHRQAIETIEQQTVLTKSRQWLTKASKGTRGLGDRLVEDDGETGQSFDGGIEDVCLQVVW